MSCCCAGAQAQVLSARERAQDSAVRLSRPLVCCRYSDDATYLLHQTTQGIGFLIARTDWQYFQGTFVFAMAVGYKFIQSETGACNGVLINPGADCCANASVLVRMLLLLRWGAASYVHRLYDHDRRIRSRILTLGGSQSSMGSSRRFRAHSGLTSLTTRRSLWRQLIRVRALGGWLCRCLC
jgi:hypothetical protein